MSMGRRNLLQTVLLRRERIKELLPSTHSSSSSARGVYLDVLQCALLSGNKQSVRLLLEIAGGYYPRTNNGIDHGTNRVITIDGNVELNPNCMKIYASYMKKTV